MNERLRMKSFSRRRFLGRAVGAAAFAGISVVVAACGSDDDDGGGMGPSGCENATSGSVSNVSAHSHSVNDVCDADAGGSLNLTLTGNGHTHSITLSSQQVDQVLAGTTVSVTSTFSTGHTHAVTFN